MSKVIYKNPIINLGTGMLGKQHSRLTKSKMSNLAKGKGNSFFGKIHTEETRERMKINHMGNKNAQFGKHHSEATKLKISKANKGRVCSEEARKKIGEANKGNKYNLSRHPSEITRKKLSLALLGKRSGDKHPMWKGGITSVNIQARNTIEYDIWRNGNFARDGYTCQKCWIRGGKLIAHHVLNFAEWVELRFAIDNGITLCKECHKLFHKKYGNQHNTREQLEEFLIKVNLIIK
ncbi:NUMOD3 domain-containing DNA-binding protein [Candidatus Dojkabacteria bacterium]|jgi:hypothetical protein|nr:NUMOD3 domain-containing DNA-binding protein [Candidatus Dojkabacteria bacterium]